MYASLLGLLGPSSGCYGGLQQSTVDERAFSGAEQAFPGVTATPGAGSFFVRGRLAPVEYEVRAGLAIHQGDIVLGDAEALTPGQRGETDVSAAAVKPDRLWIDAVVPYTLDGVGPQARVVFEAAVAHWEARSVLRFVPRTTEEDFIEVVEEPGCWSYLGRVGGAQALSLGTGCTTLGIAAHELGHAIGLWHEQSRADRDAHVIVHWENISEGHASNFETYDAQGFAGADVGAYDTGSLMHYGSGAFSVDPWATPTLTRLDGSWIEANRDALSAGDIEGAAALYGAPPPPTSCKAGLRSGEILKPGQSMPQCNGRFVLVMQADGNLMLWMDDAVLLWSTQTSGYPGAQLRMQSDGNLVVVHDGVPIWNAGTQGNPEARLQLRNGGNLRVLSKTGKTLWQTRTGGN